jgi:geranylgeranyl pyrophosphate synthase
MPTSGSSYIAKTHLTPFPKVSKFVEQELHDIISANYAAAKKLDANYARLWQSIESTIFAGGKRLRPYLAVTAYQGLGGASPAIYRVGASQELLHASLLVHDDVMDRDYSRHGRPNVAGEYLKHYAVTNGAHHMADSAAILAGDVLLSAAHQALYTSDFPSARLSQAVAYFAQAVFEVAGGQLLDMEAAMSVIGPDQSLHIARYKTASYSFIGPLAVGAALAGGSDETIQQLKSFGAILGTGFQLADDLLGLYGKPKQTGKPVISDMREGKATYLISLAQQMANTSDKDWLEHHWGQATSGPQDLITAQHIVKRSGAKAQVKQQLSDYALQSRAALKLTTLSPDAKTALSDIVDTAIWRSV